MFPVPTNPQEIDMNRRQPLPNGTQVRYHYHLNGVRIDGTGVILNDNPIIGTDYGYAVKRDSDGEVVYVYQHSTFRQQAAA